MFLDPCGDSYFWCQFIKREPHGDCSWPYRAPRVACPLSQAFSLAPRSDKDAVPSIVRLFVVRNPFAVIRAISEIIVFSLYRQMALVSVTERPGEKSNKRGNPFFANFNSTATVIFIVRALWISA